MCEKSEFLVECRNQDVNFNVGSQRIFVERVVESYCRPHTL